MSPLQPVLIVFSTLEEVWNRSQALMDEGNAPDFPGKARRSQEVVNFFGELRSVIVNYHVSELVRCEAELTRGIALTATVDFQTDNNIGCKAYHRSCLRP